MGLLRPEPLLVVGEPLSAADLAEAVQLPPSHPDPAAFIDSLPDGTVLRHFDFVARLSDRTSCRPSAAEPLRRLGDPAADTVVDILGLADVKGRGKDALAAIEEYLSRKQEELGARWKDERGEDAVWRLWDEMTSEPPEGVRGYAAGADGKEDRRATPLTPFEAVQVRLLPLLLLLLPLPSSSFAFSLSSPSSPLRLLLPLRLPHLSRPLRRSLSSS